MQGPSLTAMLAVAFCLGLDPNGSASDAVDRARASLAKDDPKAAVAVLEEALPKAGADLGPIIVVLRQAYAKAADQATKAGRPAEADEFRENLQILNRKMRARPDAPTPASEAPPKAEPSHEIGFSIKPVPKDEPPSVVAEPAPPDVPKPSPLAPSPPAEVPSIPPLPDLPVSPRPETQAERPTRSPEGLATIEEPVPAARAEADTTPVDPLREADTAYLAERYLDAKAAYDRLAKAGLLPDERKIHWAYCRSVDVVRRIKAGPKSREEWASIDREIGEIKALSPKYWYAEYLRNRAADLSRGASRPAKGQVVRGAMPESDTAPSSIRDLTRKAPPVAAQPPVGRLGKPGDFALARVSTETPQEISNHVDSGQWQVKETPNFAIYHADPALAEQVARAAESTRDAIIRHWTGSPPSRPWTPRCEVYIYPTAAIFAQVTGQPATSPGFSTMESNGVAISGRRIKLRADHAEIVACVLPHEVTHVILADLFPTQQIPRWADEGIAVLSEPVIEQEKRLADLDSVLDGGKIFAIEHLMVRDYPEGPHWGLYYAQSVSLTRFLVDQGKPGQFIDFLQGCQRQGIEPELKRVYKIDGYADLQRRWLAHAKAASTARVASAKADSTKR